MGTQSAGRGSIEKLSVPRKLQVVNVWLMHCTAPRYADVEIYQLGGGMAAGASMLPIGEESTVDLLELTPGQC